MLGYEIAAPIFMGLAMWALRYIFFDLRNESARKKAARDEYRARDGFIASIRLRLPPSAELVELEHQMCFNDTRYRAAASDIFVKNNFTVSTAETYEKSTKYWLLAKRTSLIDHSINEIQAVCDVAQRHNGTYESCNPVL